MTEGVALTEREWLLIEESLVAKQNLLFDLGNKMMNRSMPAGGRVFLKEAAAIELLLKKVGAEQALLDNNSNGENDG